MVATQPIKNSARSPQRANGVKRREGILKAAADIISESGIAGLTLQATARRAKSSIGSMYHFFTDKEQLLEALRERHRQDMEAMLSGALTISQTAWQAMAAENVIDTLFGQPIRYYSENPFALQLHDLPNEKANDAFMTLLQTVMKWRFRSDRGVDVARMLYAISTGTLFLVMVGDDQAQRDLVHQIPSALVAYLVQQEAALP